jgi:hypothetical protein
MNAPSPGSSNPAGAAPVQPVKKPRSPIERTLVWGGIAALLTVTLLELRAQQGYARTLEALGNRLDDDEEDLTLEQAKPLLAFSPALSEPIPAVGNNEIKCSWFSLFKKGQYEITLIVSKEKEPILLSYKTPTPPEDPAPPPANISGSSPSSAMGMGGGGPGMGGGGGMGGGFGGMGGAPRPNPLRDAIDTDADGELSAEEIATAPNSLGKLDKDSDGQIVAAELAPPPPADGSGVGAPSAPGGPGAGAGGGGGGGRPGRLLESIDGNGDGTITAEERAAVVEGLKKLDANGDGKIVRDELRPPGGGGFGGGFGPPGGGGGASGSGRRRPDAEETTPATATPDKPTEEAAPAAEKAP